MGDRRETEWNDYSFFFLRLEKQFSRRILKAVKFDGGKITVNGTEKKR